MAPTGCTWGRGGGGDRALVPKVTSASWGGGGIYAKSVCRWVLAGVRTGSGSWQQIVHMACSKPPGRTVFSW